MFNKGSVFFGVLILGFIVFSGCSPKKTVTSSRGAKVPKASENVVRSYVIQEKNGRYTRQEYIATFSEIAVMEMHRAGIPASITMAQAILESGDGNSELTKKGKNHFGIKCGGNWSGKKTYHDDDAKGECFRKYDSTIESFVDHSDFLANGRRYAFLFEYRKDDYKSWAKGLKKAGYATNPKYPALLIRIVEENNLDKLDKMKPQDFGQKKVVKNSTPSEKSPPKKRKSIWLETPPVAKTSPAKARPTPKPIKNSAPVKTTPQKKKKSIWKEAPPVAKTTPKKEKVTAKPKPQPVKTGMSLDNFDSDIPKALPPTAKVEEVKPDSTAKDSETEKLPPSSDEVVIHEVKKGDTLYSLSRKYSVTVQQIKDLNGLTNNNLELGDKLVIK
jgi:LysM repeat protein